ncbi:MAG TPA: histidine phosphatase family protein [Nocardioidaceae bacterium]|nr:histidine phosphatase family protein [Nocardioidaceae bacterium]
MTDATRTVVHLIRHGEVANPTGVLYGRMPDFHLSDLGRAMAERLAEWAEERDITHLVSSPLERARETMEPIATRTGVDVEIDDRVIEASNLFEGRVFGVGDGALRRPQVWWMLRNPMRPSWGEPYRQIAGRMHAAMADARDEAAGHEAVIVSHQLPVWVARLAGEGRRRFVHDPRRRQCSLASVTSFAYAGDALVSVGYTEPARDLLPPLSKKFVAGA